MDYSKLKFLINGKMSQLSQKPPVIIGGCGRSGTTLLLSILGAYTSIYAIPHESRLYSRWTKTKEGKIIPKDWRRFIGYMLLSQVPSSAERYCEKTPKNIVYLENILNYLGPDIRFIQLVRDGRDVCTSRHPRDPEAYWVSIKRWVNDVKAGLPWRDHPSVYTLTYEDLVVNTEKHIRQLCEFLEEPLTDKVLNWEKNSNIKKSGAWHHGLQKIHNKSLRKWEKPEHAERIREFMNNNEAVELLKELGYEI